MLSYMYNYNIPATNNNDNYDYINNYDSPPSSTSTATAIAPISNIIGYLNIRIDRDTWVTAPAFSTGDIKLNIDNIDVFLNFSVMEKLKQLK